MRAADRTMPAYHHCKTEFRSTYLNVKVSSALMHFFDSSSSCDPTAFSPISASPIEKEASAESHRARRGMAPSGGLRLTPGAATYLINHIVLPPKLPHKDDSNISHEQALLDAVTCALQDLRNCTNDAEANEDITTAISAVSYLGHSRDSNGHVSELQLQKLLQNLVSAVNDEVMPLEIKAQNAGLIISRSGDSVVFEAFELSPRNKATMSAVGRLVRTFPGCASKIPLATMKEEAFIQSLAFTLAKMSTQAAPGFQPQVRKTGKLLDEYRDTTNPGLVTDWFINYIAALGGLTETVRISKNTREEVLWRDCLQPWRRTPLWLLVRVALQLLLAQRGYKEDSPRPTYKLFIVHLLSRLLDSVKEQELVTSSETLYLIYAKLARRIRKLENLGYKKILDAPWMIGIQAAMTQAHALIKEDWTALTGSSNACFKSELLRSLQPAEHLDMSLPELDSDLNAIAARSRSPSRADFVPDEDFPMYPPDKLPTIVNATGGHGYYCLAALEAWIEQHLDSWLSKHVHEDSSCGKLRVLIELYHRAASAAYAGIPVALSVMYLSLAELWIACDKSACRIYPLLLEYNPEVDLTEFQCLLLPHKNQMIRLHKVERYAESRHGAAISTNPSVFRDFGHSLSFAVRYFDQSTQLRELLSKVRSDAAQKQQRKHEELEELKDKHKDLMAYYNTHSCETHWVYNPHYAYDEEEHKPGCSRCARKAQAENLSIDIYEWPVSAQEVAAKATIFELQLPEGFGDWRDATAFLMTTVFRHRTACWEKPCSQYTLEKHHDLSHIISPHYSKLRIIPLSQIKPHTVTHRKRKTGIPNLNFDDICLPNALQYAYFDKSLGGFTGVCSSANYVVQDCTYEMPSDRSKPLERFLHRPPSLDGITPNEVIASLSSCPTHFSLDEYKSFGALPLGRNIMYWNILAQLAMPSIDFTKSETQTLLLQVIEQTGTGNSSLCRLSHSILVKSSFGDAILKQVEVSLRRLSENWESWRAVATFVALSRRVLGLTECPEVRIRSLGVLAEARAVSMKWLSRLKCRAVVSTDATQQTELYSRAAEIALLCSSTFDVDEGFLDNILQQDSAISALIQCSILLQENHSFVVSESQPVYNAMLHSWRSLMHRAFVRLRHHILQGNMGLHAAVLENWADFHPAVGLYWKILSNKHEHWLQIKSGSLSVCFNLLTAQLLVDGVPLARLPPEFMQHSAYLPLFGKSILFVAPTDCPGMKFSAKSTYRDYKLHFGMGGSDMYVVAIKGKETYDLLPTRLFKDRLPTAFIDDYIHWYDHRRNQVTFRPRKEPWLSANTMWKLVRKHSKWRLVNGTDVLVDIVSHTAHTLSKIFDPLETTQHIHITMCMESFDMDIQLPRLQLDFSLRHQDIELESRQYRGMTVDPDQTFGTLVGLTSRLVLKSVKSARERLVLVPVPHTFGTNTISHSKAPGQHVVVKIAKDKAHKIFAYSLDTTLGRILANGEIQQSLFLALLHALTSHCLPDLLTGYTGTELSLNILRSAAVRSFEFLTPDNVDILQRIAALSPLRCFYPANIMEMQQVDWNLDLSSLSQHPEFRTCSEDIIRQAQTMQLFYPDKMPNTQDWSKSNPHLEEREAVRSSVFRVHGFGQERFMSGDDAHYQARDLYTQSDRGQRAYIATSLLFRTQAAFHSIVPDLKVRLLQTHFKQASIRGASHSLDLSSLRFDVQWLGDISTILENSWCDIHQHLHASLERCNKYDIAAWLSIIGFATSADMCVLQAFAAFVRLPATATVRPPSAPAFHLSSGDFWQAQKIEKAVRASSGAFHNSEEAKLPKRGAETNREHEDRLIRLHQSRRAIAQNTFVTKLKRQWPVANPVPPTTSDTDTYVNVSSAMKAVTAQFQTWYHNRLFMEYLEQISTLMTRQEAIAVQVPCAICIAPPRKHRTRGLDNMFGIDRIFAAVPPVILRDSSLQTSVHALSPPLEPELPVNYQKNSARSEQMRVGLEDLCDTLQGLASSKCEEDYVATLRASCTSLHGLQKETHGKLTSLSGDGAEVLVRHYLEACKNYFDTINLKLLQAATQPYSLSDMIGVKVQHSPRISPTFWLSQLHRDRFETLPLAWKTMIIEYGLAVTQLRRAQRLAAMSTKPADLLEELSYVGHSNWDPHEFPETLLLEAESGIMIRREQEFVAAQMRDTKDFTNTVLQLLMGGGKSSIIIPMLAVYLTDQKKLVRIIVAKPQSKQMLQMLVSKLGYLLNRRVYHMPLSRALRPDAGQADLLRKTYEECMKNRGVLLVQPEHILSFKLMAVEATLAGHHCARSLRNTQEFFQNVSRDIVDESDENFSVKFELMYTMGTQRSVELAPERWRIIQAIAGLIPRFAKEVWNKSPKSVELQRDDDGRFPRVRILDNDAAEDLIMLIAKHVVEFGIIGLPTSFQSPSTQASLLQYITETNLTENKIRAVEESTFWTKSTESALLLVRGLIAGGVLRFALGTKRWRVNFGLDPQRIPNTLLAVPFRSKDCPSPRSEFSHPDVVILLSLLSYYYGGLTDEQLFDSFAHLLKSDQAGIHYDEWVDTASPSLPIAFHQISGVSLKDHQQCIADVFPGLRYSRKTIDYYLAFLVFPKAMKEFPQKLSASGWDIGAIKTHPVTGFSGTNDTLHLLPLAVQHLDLPSQNHTNALVLQYLLQEETSVESLPPRSQVSDAQHLLSVVIRMQPEVRVILDCGALILEQNNQEVAETWLGICHASVQAVVFFADEELSVMDRAGRTEPLQTSPFAQQLDVCVVYLDEAHTRGTDLKLPRNYRAAVTLGQSLVKDKLTQGCMRMRKLGLGQSIAFLVPEEISRKIHERTGKPPDVRIKVSDVLCWSIGETWQDMKRSMPLWAVQGERFERHKNLLYGAATTQIQAASFLEDEAQTLNARYKPRTKYDSGMGSLKAWDLQNCNITKIVKRCQEFEALGFGAATLSEEQERELAPEIQAEKQIELPARLDARRHFINPQVRQLAQTGRLVKTTKSSNAWNPAFQKLETTSAAKLFKLEEFPTELLVTSDFMRTVKAPSEFISDSYQRPVQFIISVYKANSRIVEHLVIISPYEANELLEDICRCAKVTLHIFAPRINASFAPLDKLSLYNVGCAFLPEQVPRSLTMQLNLFAGSLFLRDFNEYTELCELLGLLHTKPVQGQQVFADGFIDPPSGIWGLKKSPVTFLRMFLMKIRRGGEGVEKTHLGRILNGVRLEESDFNSDTDISGA
ncbi:very large low complexity [Pyrenophora seminiperda CCB06]|uniref:ubiquitinyl hydrolase 1 n=1 Tax=Pyrenophora seminiperda CCB06 TaxID=1302712 RepID=A0A3M7MGI8_9PLEO|nr:very large low complexity [Pyrenophora seminiperda CCB06]